MITVPREVTRWALMMAAVDEWLVNAVMAKYEGAQTVRTTEGDSKAFNVKVGLHQGSLLSPLLFVRVMITRNSDVADKPRDDME